MKKKELKDVFPFEYAGGGYFREKGVPNGEKAKIIHGMEAVKLVFDKLTEEKQDEAD
jgi:hypothetical protein